METVNEFNIKCPTCGSSFYQELYNECTAVYYPPIYKDGININPDMNHITINYQCLNCGATFSITRKPYESENPLTDGIGGIIESVKIFDPFPVKEIMIKQNPEVREDGIYVPKEEYVPEGCTSEYKMIISREMFVEAYNKYIKGE